ncbi:hypothetical protein HS048_04250 [Planomonospora sp. ID91781]|uniref:hypothetical protein n=1 Tax=Planomonospora sp. ID91781 TaxID=2738135 RepID=UPI0018C41037|nr:hypothetical protein [Planomonospora sp. ID91781]MBG0819956.1 hypothetical protein [Planomonospora sp. ID91781]
MRARRLAAAALMAGGLAFGTAAVPAAAASAQAAEGWHLMGHYKLRSECVNTGFRALVNGAALDFRCTLSGSRFDLYLYY